MAALATLNRALGTIGTKSNRKLRDQPRRRCRCKAKLTVSLNISRLAYYY